MRILGFVMLLSAYILAQSPPPLETGVSQTLAVWRAARYSDVRYKLNLTLEKMSPVLKGTIEFRVKVSEPPASAGGQSAGDSIPPIILDWRKIAGHEKDSTVSNVTVNGKPVQSASFSLSSSPGGGLAEARTLTFEEHDEHLIFRDGVVAGENVIQLDFTSPILTSGSAITRYVDKEDGAEYIYSLFVPSDASTAFPVFDQPDLKARFSLTLATPDPWRRDGVPAADSRVSWKRISISPGHEEAMDTGFIGGLSKDIPYTVFEETKPISTYVFAFAAGPFSEFGDPDSGSHYLTEERRAKYKKWLENDVSVLVSTAGEKKIESENESTPVVKPPDFTHFYVRKSQAAKFQPHAAEVFRLTREGLKYLEIYFDYKFPWPKYDLVLIPEFPFGGMEHAGATFLRESSVIFPTEPTKGDYISRANLIFHETAHQWFGDTVTMRWFDDLWLKEGFAEFMAYKTLEKVMPDANAWKVFYERNKQPAYATDSTKGTTPIYQPIDNLSAAKSAYGNIVYRKAPSFLRQAEFYLGEDKFQTAVQAFLKTHEYGNATWQDLVGEFQDAKSKTESFDPSRHPLMNGRNIDLPTWAKQWVTFPGVPVIHTAYLRGGTGCFGYGFTQNAIDGGPANWANRLTPLVRFADGQRWDRPFGLSPATLGVSDCDFFRNPDPVFLFPNYGDYGYGIFLLDDKSREYVLKNIQNEKDPFLRSMMWGALWDSVREGELDPREYVELAIKQLQSASFSSSSSPGDEQAKACTLNCGESDESTIASILGRVTTAMNYYLPAGGSDLRSRLEDVLIARMNNAPTAGLRITFYRALVNNASSENSRIVLKGLLRRPGLGRPDVPESVPTVGTPVPIKTKDRFDIVTRLIILGDPDAPKLLADLEKTETSDDAKRYAYAAHAAFPTAENREKFWNDFVNNKDISESWIEAAIGPFNSIRHDDLSLPYLQRALAKLPNLKRSRKIFFVNGWLAAFIGGQRSQAALDIVNKFLADNPNLDKDLKLKILENVDVIERAVKIRSRWR